MTWYHPALAQRALDEGDAEIRRLRQEVYDAKADYLRLRLNRTSM